MLFDVQAALAEILSSPVATPATYATPASNLHCLSRMSRVSQPHYFKNAHSSDVPPSPPPPPSAPVHSGDEAETFREGQDLFGRPRTWTGRIVNLDEWLMLSAWDRHGPGGRIYCGLCCRWCDFCEHTYSASK